MAQFTNVHIHIFNGGCAPESFFKVIPVKLARKMPELSKLLIENSVARYVIVKLAALGAKKPAQIRSTVDKYISFLKVGTTGSQIEIFEEALKAARFYSPIPRVVVLPLDMDYMDEDSKVPVNYNTQLKDVKKIKKYYPDNCFPFLCIDPRRHQGKVLVSWGRKFFEKGLVSRDTGEKHPFFTGLKIYPALGFFPFDPALADMYAYAEERGIPVMSHCTRVGSQYIGTSITSLIVRNPKMIVPNIGGEDFENVRREIIDRIDRYYKGRRGTPWIGYTLLRNNDLACDLFSHPQNYVPLLLRYPKLKICLAHMGGTEEILKLKKGADIVQKMDGHNWFSLIKEMMTKYPNLYTDISYTLSALEMNTNHDESEAAFVREQIQSFLNTLDINNEPLGKRVLFGTDFYMTEREAREPELYKMAGDHLSDWFQAMSQDNCERYLFVKPK